MGLRAKPQGRGHRVKGERRGMLKLNPLPYAPCPLPLSHRPTQTHTDNRCFWPGARLRNKSFAVASLARPKAAMRYAQYASASYFNPVSGPHLSKFRETALAKEGS